MQEFLVGGAIRDKILGIATESTEKDYVVVGSSSEEMQSLGFRQVGKEFPVFLHPKSNEEYALARLERKIGKGYKGFEFDTSKSVTLEQDLSRRDLTINAIAQNKDGSGEFIELTNEMGALACGFEPGNLYSSYARDLKGLDVQNCGWENYECKEKVDLVTAFHVFEHLTDPLKALQKAVSWLKTNGLIYIEVPNMANGLKLKGFGSLHMAHTIGFGRYSLELLGAFTGMVPFEVFDEYDIGIIFKKGHPRPLEEIKKDSINEFSNFNVKQVNRRFWFYSAGKIFGKRSKP